MAQNVPIADCSAITSGNCGEAYTVDAFQSPLYRGSWQSLFCICSNPDVINGVASQSPTVNWHNGDGPPGIEHDVAGLQGVYSTAASVATTAPATSPNAQPTQDWSGVDNILEENGTYASIALDLPEIGPWEIMDDVGVALQNGIPSTMLMRGSPYLVAQGFGFNLPLDAQILGIAVGVKGYSAYTAPIFTTPLANNGYGDPVPFDPNSLVATPRVFGDITNPPITPGMTYYNVGDVASWNIALTVNNQFYYYADPRSDALSVNNSVLATGPLTTAPYIASGPPIFGSPQGYAFGNQPIGFHDQFATGHDYSDAPHPLIVPLGRGFLFNAPLVAPNGNNVLQYPMAIGVISACDPNNIFHNQHYDQSGGSTPYLLGTIEKGFSIPQLKQTWTPAEMNDPSFGIAASFCQLVDGFHPGSDPTATFAAPGPSPTSVFVDCFGVAVYYKSVQQQQWHQPNVFLIT